MHLGNEHRPRCTGFGRRKLSTKADHAIAGPNFEREREVRKFPWPKRQIWNNALQRALEVEQVEAAARLCSPIPCARNISPEQNSEMPFFLSGRRDKRAPDFKDRDGLGSGANISFEHFEQAADQARPQRDMIFAQRIAQLDRAFTEGGGTSR